MNIINEYTFHHLKNNKRHTISIMIAISIASALLCSLCIFGHTIWKAKVKTVIKNTGYWHGELRESVSGDKIKYINENPEVKMTMIKGQWVTAKLSNTKRSYLLMRDADSNFWNEMSLKNTLMEGRLPKAYGEIVVSKVFFEDNPSYKIGDKVVLPIGNRMLGDKLIETNSQKRKGEYFKSTGKNTYTIVGKLDVSGVSAYPGYIAMGYLERSRIKPNDELTVYINMQNPRKIYKTLPKIAKSIGFKKDEYGKYCIVYNKQLLNLYAIKDKNEMDITCLILPIMIIAMLLLVMGTFIIIIYNAFSLSANSRIKELGILKSLGATPKQIKYSVLYEGLLLCIPQIPIGIIIGYIFSNVVVSKINGILSGIEDYSNIEISFSWYVISFAIIISLITVLVSAYIPARKVAKVPPIESIRQNDNKMKSKKQKSHPIIKKLFGIEGELALVQFSANKRKFRTAIISLSMCFILVSVYFCITSTYNYAISRNEEKIYYDMSLDLNITHEPSDEMMKKILGLNEVKDSVVSRMIRTSTYVKPEQESTAFSRLGGFTSINSYKYNVLNKNGKYRIIVNLVGLSNMSFEKYCKKIGADAKAYYKEGVPKGVLLDSTYHRSNTSKTIEKIPMLNVKKNDKLLINEKIADYMNTDYNFNVKVGAVTEVSPCDLDSNRYSVAFIVPMKVYKDITDNFKSEHLLSRKKMKIDLVVGDKASSQVKKKLTQICSYYLGSEDFNIWSLLEEQNNRKLKEMSVKSTVLAIALMIGAIGIVNTFSTVSNNLKLRRREFAVFRSTGLTPKGINKMLLLEGMFFVIRPILISIPFLFLICWLMLRITLVTWTEFMLFCPILEILIYTAIMILCIALSYKFSSKSIKNDTIIDAIKDKTI
ncbi:FtsX-like permease family protein (plasmid) [Haloimpatiens sp. FM7330]|uniref:ABC transporter permease n=1 Tax=Haloimpatiens sp. FM7330 TaxID=3298610 RepID=UPI00362A6017